MKKIFILTFSIFTFLNTNSQNLSVPHYGIKLGYNHSSFNFTQYNKLYFGSKKPTEGYAKPNQIANLGLKGGFFVDLKISKKWYISPTLSYSQFGSETRLEKQWDTDTIRTYGFMRENFNMEYITLDPLFDYRPTDKISLIVGPSISYLISNNLIRYVEEEGIERTSDGLNDEIPGVSEIDAGLNLGISYFITENLDIDFNTYLGMIGFETFDDGYDKTIKAFSFSIGYTFN
tara:strand:- start:1612 stop:2307 length:696 start_codon:yes stop_codon:yes gene_type:complete